LKGLEAMYIRLSTTLTIISLMYVSASLSKGQENKEVLQPHAIDITSASISSLPSQPLGIDDLVSVFVYGAPELSRSMRVDTDGMIRVPLLKQRVKAEGLTSKELEVAIAQELKKEQIFLDPEVTVSVTEYRSRPINVVGAVRHPTTFQATNHT